MWQVGDEVLILWHITAMVVTILADDLEGDGFLIGNELGEVWVSRRFLEIANLEH